MKKNDMNHKDSCIIIKKLCDKLSGEDFLTDAEKLIKAREIIDSYFLKKYKKETSLFRRIILSLNLTLNIPEITLTFEEIKNIINQMLKDNKIQLFTINHLSITTKDDDIIYITQALIKKYKKISKIEEVSNNRGEIKYRYYIYN